MSTGFLVLLVTSFLSTLTSSLLWTGFPVFLNDFGHASLGLSQIYACATLGSLLFGLAGGVLSDLGSCKRVSVASHLMSALMVGAGFLVHGRIDAASLAYALPVVYFNFAVGGTAELVWVVNFDRGVRVEGVILDRAVLVFLAKLIGFSSGPVLFNLFGSQGLAWCAGSFLAVALVQLFVPDSTERVGPAGATVSLGAIYGLVKSPAFVLATVLTGVLSIPLNPLFVSHVLTFGRAADASVFWALAGGAGLLNLLLQRLGLLRITTRSAAVASALLLLSSLVALSTERPWLFFVASSSYVFWSLSFSVSLYQRVGSRSVRNGLGGSFGLLNLLVDAGIFAGMLLGPAAARSPTTLVVTLAGLLTLRLAAFWRLR